MKKQVLLVLIASLWIVGLASAQIQFVKKTNLLTPPDHFSGVAIAVLDMNGDGLDDIVRMDMGIELAIEYQTAPDQPFTHLAVGDIPSFDGQWGICAADLDNNGFPDVLTGGRYDDIKVVMSNADGSAYNIDILDEPGTFVQGVNFADINNDGWLDAFVCHDDGVSRIFGNDGTGYLEYQPDWINLATVPASDNSGNYGSVWSDVDNDGDLDLYIAKCRQLVTDSLDPRRINQLFLNNGDGTYSQDTSNASGLRIGAQSWTADFGDIDNDGDFDCFITNHDVSSQLLENDGAGHFTDISLTAGVFDVIDTVAIQGVFRDFDNDGYVDILVGGGRHFLFHNNGDKTFSLINDLFDNKQIESYGVGDLNHDGFQDIYAGYAETFNDPGYLPDELWMNAGNDNRFFGLTLHGVQSNRNGVGAKVVLHSTLGIQVREVRSGESYGIMNSMLVHFGVGQTTVDSVKVYWPSGIVDVIYQPAVNQYITLEEGGCIVPQVTAIPNGPTTFCSGDSVVIGVSDDFDAYKWSTGATTATISVNAAGNYSVTVTTNEGCTGVSNVLPVSVDPVQIPAITASGDTTFCAGGSVLLTSSPATLYTWSNGDTTQSITVTQSGDYWVTTQGLCASFTSAPMSAKVLDNPAPDVTGDTIAPAQSALLSASGNQPHWYDAATGGSLLYTGNPFLTPPLDASTTYWVSDTISHDEPNQNTGMTNHEGNLFGDPQFNGAIIFDCYTPFRLAKIKVYANTAAERKIDLRNDDGDILQTKIVNIPSGTTVIGIDFDIPAGNDLVLTTDQAFNVATLGTLGPQLRRSTQGVTYPYIIPKVVHIKSSNFGPERYFYFYDWEVDFYVYECTSERVPVTAVVDPALNVGLPDWVTGVHLFPNPVSTELNIEIEGFTSGDLTVAIKNAQGATLQTRRHGAQSGDAVAMKSDLSNFSKGVYWVELACANGIVRRKVIVQ